MNFPQIASVLKLFFILMIFLNALIWIFDSSQLATVIPVNSFFIAFLLPLYLNFADLWAKKAFGYFLKLLLKSVILLTVIAINYFLWGVITEMLLAPDGETIAIIYVQIGISFVILLITSLFQIKAKK